MMVSEIADIAIVSSIPEWSCTAASLMEARRILTELYLNGYGIPRHGQRNGTMYPSRLKMEPDQNSLEVTRI